jgi:hypothetical protein
MWSGEGEERRGEREKETERERERERGERERTKGDDSKETEEGKDEVVSVWIRGRENPAEVGRGHGSSMGGSRVLRGRRLLS